MPNTGMVIYNCNGDIVYQKKDGFDLEFDFSDKSPGVYFIKFSFKDNQTLIKKVIKY